MYVLNIIIFVDETCTFLCQAKTILSVTGIIHCDTIEATKQATNVILYLLNKVQHQSKEHISRRRERLISS